MQCVAGKNAVTEIPIVSDARIFPTLVLVCLCSLLLKDSPSLGNQDRNSCVLASSMPGQIVATGDKVVGCLGSGRMNCSCFDE